MMEPSNFFWDQWKERADAANMRADVATAGRALVRECYQHGWENFMGPGIQTLCGYDDNGEALLAFGLAYPDLAERIWNHLVADDAGNNPRPPRATKEVKALIMWVFSHRTWPAVWPPTS